MIPEVFILFLVAAAAYLIGAIPTAVIISKAVHRRDIRLSGSGNPGAANMWRTFGMTWAAIVIAVDFGKGFLVAWQLPRLFGWHSPAWAAALGLLAVMGHVWSPYIHFGGGKGVGVALGAATALYPPLGLASIAVWIAVVFISSYASLGSLLAIASYPAALYWREEYERIELLLALATFSLILFTHRSNIRRLATGRELKVGMRRDRLAAPRASKSPELSDEK